RPWYLQDALVVGPADQAAAIIRKIERHPEWRIRATAHVETSLDDPWVQPTVRSPGAELRPEDRDLIALVRQVGVDRVMLASALSESCRRGSLICELSDLGVHVDLIPSWSDAVGARLQLHELEGMPLLTVPRPALGRSAYRLKRAFDVAVAPARSWSCRRCSRHARSR